MAIHDVAVGFFTFESRMASFQTAQPIIGRRASNASSRAPKTMKWPHKFLQAEQLAKAGFFFYPSQANPDNCACFLCHRSIDAWEEGDDPLAEHLKHSPDCGWAIVTTIEMQPGELSQEYPGSKKMVEARKATFGGQWPHESKKGWKCKTKQLVDAGWKYTPTAESDDMATCTYCSLALDGWEPADKPHDEHYNRSPECPFFTIQKPKSTRGRASKASRMSTQSVNTTLMDEDLPELEPESEPEPPAKRGRAPKGTRMSTQSVNTSIMEDDIPEQPTKKGRVPKGSRMSTQSINAAMLSEDVLEKPAKRGRAPKANRMSTQSANTTIADEIVPQQPTKKGRAPKGPRMSTQSVNTTIMDENVPQQPKKRGRAPKVTRISTESTAPAPKSATPPKAAKKSRISAQTEVLDASELPIEFKELNEPEALAEPKSPTPTEATDEPDSHVQPDAMDEPQASIAPKSPASANALDQAESPAQNEAMDEPESPTQAMALDGPEIATQTPKNPVSEIDNQNQAMDMSLVSTHTQKSKTSKGSNRGQKRKSDDLEDEEVPAPKRTTRTRNSKLISKASAASLRAPTPERVPSLSPSSQSSDAENRPPSSRPSLQKIATPQTVKRAPPNSSPSKRNIIAGPQSANPWEELDLDTIFMSGDENEYERSFFGAALDKLKNGDLSSPEKKMTVEQWIYHNAEVAEQKLKEECERMVGIFEREGMKALACLEGIQVAQ